MSETTLNYEMRQTAIEVLDTAEQPAASSEAERRRQMTGLNSSGTLDSTTTPAIEKPAVYQSITLGAGTTTVDLTAIPAARDPSVSIDNTGKKLIGVRLVADDGNAANVTVAPGASNPYPLFGTGNSLVLVPGMRLDALIVDKASGYVAVGPTAKTIDVSGTANDVLRLQLLFGT